MCEELGIREEELQPRDQQYFADPRLSPDVVRLRSDRYETKRLGLATHAQIGREDQAHQADRRGTAGWQGTTASWHCRR